MNNTKKYRYCEKRNSKLKKLFLEKFKENAGSIYATCEQVGIVYNTYRKWRETDKEFDEACENIEMRTLDFVEKKLLSQINNGNITAIIFYLINRSKGKWKNTQKIEHNVSEDTKDKIESFIENVSKILKKD